jgi:spermidine synthase
VGINGRIIHRSRNSLGQIIVADYVGKRSLYLDGDTLQSCMFLNNPTALVMEYSHAMMCALLFNTPGRVLLIGLGGASLVKFLLRFSPRIQIEVAEINPAVIEIARNFFFLETEMEQVSIYHSAGQELVGRRLAEGRQYDMVLIDAFDDNGPARALLQREFLYKCRRLLRGGGIFAINLWNRPEDGFCENYSLLAEIFESNILKLLLAESYANAIAFGFNAQIKSDQLHKLKPRAKTLGKTTGVNFAKYLRTLYWQNFS